MYWRTRVVSPSAVIVVDDYELALGDRFDLTVDDLAQTFGCESCHPVISLRRTRKMTCCLLDATRRLGTTGKSASCISPHALLIEIRL